MAAESEWPSLSGPTNTPTPTSTATWGPPKNQAPPPPPASEAPEQAVSRLVGSCRSAIGVAIAVVDANAVISSANAVSSLTASAGKLVTVPEALDEVRDAAARRRLGFMPLPVETAEPAPEFVKKVVKFARETGDLQTLSDVDIKIIALSYMLEAQIHGTSHLREHPPPLRVVNVRHLPEAQMPGWGSNVPNLAEWEALDQMADGDAHQDSKILPLKDLSNEVMSNGNQHDEDQSSDMVEAPQEEVNNDGEENKLPNGANALQEDDTENDDGWIPAVSRSTHRRYLRRKARHESLHSEVDVQSPRESGSGQIDGDNLLSEGIGDNKDYVECKDNAEEQDVAAVEYMCTAQQQIKSSNGASEYLKEENEQEVVSIYLESDHMADSESGSRRYETFEEDDVNVCTGQLDNLEVKSEADESNVSNDASCTVDGSSEQSWALRSLSESTVACVTSDYAMQNVILQIGLRLLAPGGMQIRQLHRWVLRCHACFKVTQDIGRIFCPKCGNGGTLRKVSVTVGENGIIMAARRPRVILRGTKFSLPMPIGGREAITKNPILREDQLPQKVLHPKSKKPSKKEDDFLSADDIFSHTGEKRAPLKPPVRKALAMFSGKRNPNDNHFSRKKH